MPKLVSRLLAVAIAGLAVYLAATGVFGPRGLLALNALRAEAASLHAQNEELANEVSELTEQAKRLRDTDTAIEEVAREEHGFLREGEVIYQFKNEDEDLEKLKKLEKEEARR